MSHRMIRVDSNVYERLRALRSRPGEPISEVVSRLARVGEPPRSREGIFEALLVDGESRWSPSEQELDRLDALQAAPRVRGSRSRPDDETLG